MKRKTTTIGLILVTLSLLFTLNLSAQKKEEKQKKEENKYIPPPEKDVQQKLEWWQDCKFGILFHWQPSSQWGVVESWSICPEDEGWCQRNLSDYNEYIRRYENLKYSFNPIHFNPDKWAKDASDCGMKYVVFTTKHHDGFCMFDTKTTDYKITDKECPFSKNPKANVIKEVFNAFRNNGLGIGAYFSKPDWHSKDYWWDYFPVVDRNPNYDLEKYPERWNRFKDFTFKQIEELTTGYGKVDILWLDGGWVRSKAEQTEESLSWLKRPALNQDINMPAIAAMARKNQPGLIVVDRSVHGKYENYQTPEQQIPDKPLPYLWETCMTMATSWSWVYNDHYKPTNKIIHLLVDIVSKGGNFLLNVGPDPSGQLDDTAYLRMKEIGEWIHVNGEAIYGSRTIEPYKEGKVCFTKGKNGEVYAIYLAEEGEKMPTEIKLDNYQPKANATATVLGSDKASWKANSKGCIITLPANAVNNPPCKHAWVIKIN